MNPDEQRIAIAKACGWSKFTPDTIQYTARRADGKWGGLPDYLNDLNAMHEVEKQLNTPVHMQKHAWNNYKTMLEDATNGSSFHATAAQRAEAYLRTLNLWTE